MATNMGIRHGFSGFSVTDIEAARSFYADTIGIDATIEPEMGMLRLKLPGGAEVMVYPREDHQPAVYTVLNFEVADIDTAVDALSGAGVAFERYDGFEQDEKGIARGLGSGRGPSIAWFTDPARNILAVLQNQ
jgi:catechol 2,3-dioxygenase-like lactoylglutathione lyase family enzyme